MQTGRAEKVDESNGVIFVVFMFPSWVMILKYQQKNQSILNQFIYMHLKDLVTHFQKMLLFTMQWLNILEILVFEIEEFCSIYAERATCLIS